MAMTGVVSTRSDDTDIATFAGGCFWCLEAIFEQIKGVASVESGYIGGDIANPTYEAVCGGNTGHAEAVQMTFDPRIISYRELVELFLTIHDPTTRNRQGNDIGTQYRSCIFYHSEEQHKTAESVIAVFNQEKLYPNPIVTQLVPATEWYKAEAYHQRYFANNPAQGYCQFVVAPKVAKFRKQFFCRLKT